MFVAAVWMKAMDSKFAVTVFILGLALCGPVAKSDDSSLNDRKVESPEGEAIMALEKLVADNRKLRDEVEDLKKVAANATSESEVFKRQVTDISLRMEALGASTSSPSALEQRVLQAANSLRHAETAQAQMSAALVRLAKVAGELLKKADPELKIVLDAELKKADEALAKAAIGGALEGAEPNAEQPQTLLRGRVSAVKPELDCVVINLGAKQGVKVGMPFSVKRGDKEIAILRVVDARQSFSGTVIQKQLSDKEPVKLGDTISIDAKL